MSIQNLAWVFAAIFLVAGVLGFVPGVTDEAGMLLGIFEVDTLHNIIHLASGIVAALVAMSSAKNARLFFQIFGVVYGLVAVVGLIQGDNVLGLIMTNMADHILHVVLAVAMLWIGFGMKDTSMSSSMGGGMSSGMGGGMRM